MAGHPAEAVRDVAELRRRVAACRLCVPAVTPPGVLWARPHHRALLVGQAPGAIEAELGLPFMGAAGRRLRRWLAPLGLEEDEAFRHVFAIAAVAKCYPGRAAGGRGDRVPTRRELDNCRPWTAAALRLLDPAFVVPVGRLALAEWLPPAPLREVVGRRFEAHGRVVVPLPHPSGASSWANAAANRALIDQAVALIGAELRRFAAAGPDR